MGMRRALGLSEIKLNKTQCPILCCSADAQLMKVSSCPGNLELEVDCREDKMLLLVENSHHLCCQMYVVSTRSIHAAT
jgi:hypothetical protein